MAGEISLATPVPVEDGDLIPIYRPGQDPGDKFVVEANEGESELWTPTYAGFSADPTFVAEYATSGDMCFCNMYPTAHGTNNVTSATGITFTLPFVAARNTRQWMHLRHGASNLTTPCIVVIIAGSNIATIYRDGNLGTAWANAQTTSWAGQFFFKLTPP